jgi:hypothetical protein
VIYQTAWALLPVSFLLDHQNNLEKDGIARFRLVFFHFFVSLQGVTWVLKEPAIKNYRTIWARL